MVSVMGLGVSLVFTTGVFRGGSGKSCRMVSTGARGRGIRSPCRITRGFMCDVLTGGMGDGVSTGGMGDGVSTGGMGDGVSTCASSTSE